MWKFVTGQATGSAHEKLRVPCQDRFACIALQEHAAFIAAVADGAGSASLAHINAGLAVEAITAISQLGVRAGRHDHDRVLWDGATLARTRIFEEAAARGVAARELACTLLAVVVTPASGAALHYATRTAHAPFFRGAFASVIPVKSRANSSDCRRRSRISCDLHPYVFAPTMTCRSCWRLGAPSDHDASAAIIERLACQALNRAGSRRRRRGVCHPWQRASRREDLPASALNPQSREAASHGSQR